MSRNAPEASHRTVEILRQASERRADQPPEPRTSAYRLLNGPADGGPAGLVLDRYEGWLVLGARTGLADDVVKRWAESAVAAFDPDGLVIKRQSDDPRASRSEVWGDRPPPLIVAREGDARFECRLNDGVQTGLFLDHRETRWAIRPHARDVEVLNLFAYTCAFSVHAALAGARRVTSVDVSQRALSWGRRNMNHSGLDADRHRWFTDDALGHVRRKRRRYGLVILDPPVFGHGRRPFSLRRDLGPLLEGSLEQLETGGVLVVSTHHTSVDHQGLEAALMTAAHRLQADVQVETRMGLPIWDHPVLEGGDPAADRGDYLDTVFARLRR